MMRHTFMEDFKSNKLTKMFVGLSGRGVRTDSDPPCLHYFHCIRVNVDEGVLFGWATIARINETATNVVNKHGEQAAETLPISDWLVTTARLIELDQQIWSLCYKLMTLCFRMLFSDTIHHSITGSVYFCRILSNLCFTFSHRLLDHSLYYFGVPWAWQVNACLEVRGQL